MNKLNKAIILSAKIHSGKKGRNNEPAVLHPNQSYESNEIK